MTILVKKDHNWQPLKDIYTYHQGLWKIVENGYIRKNHSWHKFWQNIKVATNNQPQNSINIYEIMGNPKQKGNFIFINNAEIIANNGEIALTTGKFPDGSVLTIINNSYIIGYGGYGGSLYQEIDSNGGDAISVETPCTVNNINGYILAGGGGGGGIKLIYKSTAGASSGTENMYLSGGGGFPNGANQIKFLRSGNTSISKTIVEPQDPPNNKDGSIYIYIGSSMSCKVITGSGGQYGQQGNISKKISDSISSGNVFKVTVTTMSGGNAGMAIKKNGHEVNLINTDVERIKGEIQ